LKHLRKVTIVIPYSLEMAGLRRLNKLKAWSLEECRITEACGMRERLLEFRYPLLVLANSYQDIGRGVHPTDLDNPIHKIFRRERWEVTDEDYEVLLPSMRLASNLLAVGMDFIASFLPSDNLHNNIGSRLSYLEEYHGGDGQIPLIKDPDAQDLATAREELNDVANVVKWQINNEMWRNNQWLGITRLTNGPKPWRNESPVEVYNSDNKLKKSGDAHRLIVIGIAGEYVDALKKFSMDSEEHLHARF
jgi:hypothetical protein